MWRCLTSVTLPELPCWRSKSYFSCLFLTENRSDSRVHWFLISLFRPSSSSSSGSISHSQRAAMIAWCFHPEETKYEQKKEKERTVSWETAKEIRGTDREEWTQTNCRRRESLSLDCNQWNKKTANQRRSSVWVTCETANQRRSSIWVTCETANQTRSSVWVTCEAANQRSVYFFYFFFFWWSVSP